MAHEHLDQLKTSDTKASTITDYRGYLRGPKPSSDFSFLSPTQVDAVIDAYPDDVLGPIDRAIVLTAAKAGLRQGELIALR